MIVFEDAPKNATFGSALVLICIRFVTLVRTVVIRRLISDLVLPGLVNITTSRVRAGDPFRSLGATIS